MEGFLMAWRQGGTVSDARRAFLADYERGVPLNALLAAYDIKKSAAYELLKRARELPLDEAVAIKSRAPHTRPNTLNDDVIERVVRLKKEFPNWGPKKLVRLFAERFHEPPPSTASVSNALKARGMTRVNRRRRSPWLERPLTVPTQPNDVWATDHKGKMKAVDDVEPLTVVDLHSRYWLACRPFTDKSYKDTRAAFERLFDDVGMPLVMRVDAGQPWASMLAPMRLTQLSAWWLALGIKTEIVSSCQANGCVERLHGTMERDMNVPVDDVRKHFDEHRRIYNELRPHEALGMRKPADAYSTSPRRPVERTYDPIDRGCDEGRPVQRDGTISWRGANVKISKALGGRRVGLRRRTVNAWSVHYYELELGSLTDGEFVHA